MWSKCSRKEPVPHAHSACAQTAEENIKIHKTIHYLLFLFHLGVLKDFVMIALPSCVNYNVSLYFNVGCLFRRYINLLRFKTYGMNIKHDKIGNFLEMFSNKSPFWKMAALLNCKRDLNPLPKLLS